MACEPMLTRWGLLFLRKDGRANRLVVTKKVAEFVKERGDELAINGGCLLSGPVSDGSEVITSYVKSIKRLERGMLDDIPHDLLATTTESGTYYMYSDGMSAGTMLMVASILYNGGLDEREWFYLDRRFWGSEYL